MGSQGAAVTREIASLIAADAANEGADTETLTIDAIESAIVADLTAGHETPTVANRARLFSAAGSFDARRAEEDHPALCKLLDEAFS